MLNTATAIKREDTNGFSGADKKEIHNYKKAADCLEKTVRSHETDNQGKAALHMKNAIIAIYERILEDKFLSEIPLRR